MKYGVISSEENVPPSTILDKMRSNICGWRYGFLLKVQWTSVPDYNLCTSSHKRVCFPSDVQNTRMSMSSSLYIYNKWMFYVLAMQVLFMVCAWLQPMLLTGVSSLIARFVGLGPTGSRPHVGPMNLAIWDGCTFWNWAPQNPTCWCPGDTGETVCRILI